MEIIQTLSNNKIDKIDKKVVIQKDKIKFIERKSERDQEKITK